MKAGVKWTPELDAKLRTLRLDGRTWHQVAVEMGFGRNTVLERGRKIGAPRSEVQVDAAPDYDKRRPVLAPGAPESWGAINRGLAIEGEAYQPLNGVELFGRKQRQSDDRNAS